MSRRQTYDAGELYALVAKGDQEAMSEVFRQYYPRLLYFATAVIHQQQEGEDLAMKALSALWEHATRNGIPIDNIESWLFTIVRNGCYDYLKHQKVLDASRDALSTNEEQENVIESTLIQEDIIQKIYEEIQHLPERCREVSILAYIRGLDTDEIARELNITASTVRSQKARAKELLRVAMIRNKFISLWPLLFFL